MEEKGLRRSEEESVNETSVSNEKFSVKERFRKLGNQIDRCV